MIYTSSKRFELGSTAFRQPNADSHCKFVHGYQLNAEITFGCSELDSNNWVYDFGALKELKGIFNNQFDHTLVIAANDPLLDIFKALNEASGADLRIMEGGVGIEKFAEWVYKTADTYIDETTEGRVWVENVTVFEHGNNSASCSKGLPVNPPVPIEEGTSTYVTHEQFEETWKKWASENNAFQTQEERKEQQEQQEQQSTDNNSNSAPVGGQGVSQGKGNWFEGTSWG